MLTIFAPHGYLQCANDKPFCCLLLVNTPFVLHYRPRDTHMNNGSVTYIAIHAVINQFRAFSEALPVRKCWFGQIQIAHRIRLPRFFRRSDGSHSNKSRHPQKYDSNIAVTGFCQTDESTTTRDIMTYSSMPGTPAYALAHSGRQRA